MLGDFHLFDHLSERSTIPGAVLPNYSYLLGSLSLANEKDKKYLVIPVIIYIQRSYTIETAGSTLTMLLTRVEQERTEDGGAGSRVQSEWAGQHDVFVFMCTISFWHSDSSELFTVDRLPRTRNVREHHKA